MVFEEQIAICRSYLAEAREPDPFRALKARKAVFQLLEQKDTMPLAHALQSHLDAFDRLLVTKASPREINRERTAALSKLAEIERLIARP